MLGPKKTSIGICCFPAKHTTLKSKNKDWLTRSQDNLSGVTVFQNDLGNQEPGTEMHKAALWYKESTLYQWIVCDLLNQPYTNELSDLLSSSPADQDYTYATIKILQKSSLLGEQYRLMWVYF